MSLSVALGPLVAQIGKELLGRTMKGEGWELLGTYTATPTGGGRYHVDLDRENPLRLVWGANRQALVIPWASMETDFASVPDVLQHMAPHSGVLHLDSRAYERSALLHDAVYAAGWLYAVWQGRAVVVRLTREQADSLLYAAMRCEKATVADAVAYYGAVSVFGKKPWRKWRANPPAWPTLYGREALA